MAITRPHICELTLATAQPDDHGNVRVAVANTPLTPDEARELAAEIYGAADTAAAYRAEQAAASATVDVVHGMPLTGYSTTTCCGRDPFELPNTDRLTADADAITCPGRSES